MPALDFSRLCRRGASISENRIDGNARSGIGVHSGSGPTIRHNTITDSGQSGLYFSEYAGGTAEENTIVRYPVPCR
jgi:parallel beta-helix repeat protein